MGLGDGLAREKRLNGVSLDKLALERTARTRVSREKMKVVRSVGITVTYQYFLVWKNRTSRDQKDFTTTLLDNRVTKRDVDKIIGVSAKARVRRIGINVATCTIWRASVVKLRVTISSGNLFPQKQADFWVVL